MVYKKTFCCNDGNPIQTGEYLVDEIGKINNVIHCLVGKRLNSVSPVMFYRRPSSLIPIQNIMKPCSKKIDSFNESHWSWYFVPKLPMFKQRFGALDNRISRLHPGPEVMIMRATLWAFKMVPSWLIWVE